MEINNPEPDVSTPFFVTNGLLTRRADRRVHTGNRKRRLRAVPPGVYTDDRRLRRHPRAVTYAAFQGVSNTQAGEPLTPPTARARR